ncbi:polysaccharide biosynthesis/export family protein [Candidatus Margulisiibacteriota bacterium]
MKKILLILAIVLNCSFAIAEDVIEIGDILSFHAVDEKRTDLILGTVTQMPTYQVIDPHEVKVSNNGRVYLLNIGAFYVAGKTPSEVETMIKKKLSNFYKGVEVSVLQKTIRSNKIYVIGEVNAPGLVEIPRWDKTRNKLLNAVKMAGGFSSLADKSKVVIMRGGENVFEANIYKLVENSELDQNFPLVEGDSIIVRKGFSHVYVLGEVCSPGGKPFVVKANPLEYLSEAGGFTDKADMNNIGIVRRRGDKVYIQKIRADLIQSVITPVDVEMQEGDIIYVAKHFFADWKDLGLFFGVARDTVIIYDAFKQ